MVEAEQNNRCLCTPSITVAGDGWLRVVWCMQYLSNFNFFFNFGTSTNG